MSHKMIDRVELDEVIVGKRASRRQIVLVVVIVGQRTRCHSLKSVKLNLVSEIALPTRFTRVRVVVRQRACTLV